MTLDGQSKSSFEYRIEHWTHWAEDHGYPAVPARPEHLIEYIGMKDATGIVAATIHSDILAISRLHRDLGEEDPLNDEVKALLTNMMKNYSPSKVVQTITRERLTLIKENACLPRSSENPDKARQRGLVDIALISTMRDALLRSEGARRIVNSDIIESEDGSGVLKIHDDHWQDAYLSADTMIALSPILCGLSGDERVFPLPMNSLYRRIRKATKYAGLSSAVYNSDSPRLGMAEDLIVEGFGLPAVMAAGRWCNPDFLNQRFKKELGKRGAIAQLFGTAERR